MNSLLKTITIGTIFACGVQFCFGERQETFQQWRTLFESQTNQTVFDSPTKFTDVWPKVYSSELSASKPKAEQIFNNKYLELSQLLVNDIKEFIADARQLSYQQNLQRSDAALRLRDMMVTNFSYCNAVLADVLNRSVYIILAIELGRQSKVDVEYERQLDHLKSFHIAETQWIAMVSEELGKPLSGFQSLGEDKDVYRFYLNLWQLLGGGSSFQRMPASFLQSNITITPLHKQRDLAMILYRNLITDMMIKRLVLATSYKKATKDFSLTDSEGEISKIIPPAEPLSSTYVTIVNGKPKVTNKPREIDKSRFSLGEHIFGQLDNTHVKQLFQWIQSGDIQKQVLIEHSDFLPPSYKKEQTGKSQDIGGKPVIWSVSQQTTNQTAVGIQQIPGTGKTNDLGTAGNAGKP